MKKLLSIGAASILLLGIAGCGNPLSQSGSASQAAYSQAQSEAGQTGEFQSSAASASEAPVQSAESGSSAPADGTSPQTQRELRNEIGKALNTSVPVMLPAEIPLESGGYPAASTVSQTAHYEVNYNRTDSPAELNSEAASKGTLIATVSGTEYKDASAAQDSISGYETADLSSADQILDLGHSIKAVEDAGLGHAYLTWNEGRWCISIDSPNDPAYKNDKYPDNIQLAKDIVAYLEDAMLPAPQKIGVISIVIWNTCYSTAVEWQNDKTVYQVLSGDPMTALKTAVAMEAE